MKKSVRPIWIKANLLIFLFVLLVGYSQAQERRPVICEETNYNCLIGEYSRIVSLECAKNGYQYECMKGQYAKIIEASPKAPEAYFMRGMTSYHREPDRAIQDFNKAIELNPNYFQPYLELALLYWNVKKNFDRSIEAFNRLIDAAQQEAKFADNKKASYLRSAYVNRGHVYLKHRDFDKALADFDKITELFPKSASGYAGRGGVFEAQGDYEKALVQYNKAIGLEPNNFSAYHIRGKFYLQRGEKEKAEADFVKAEKLQTLANKP